MPIKIGEQRISSLDLDLFWQCSSCGSANLTVQKLTVEVDNQNPHAAENANKKLAQHLSELQKEDISYRYDHAQFTCQCSSCGNKEPWAKINNKIFSGLLAGTITLLSTFAAIVVFAFSGFYNSLVQGEAFGIFLLCAIGGLAVTLAILLFLNKKRLQNLRKQISQLQPSAIPKIFTHSSTRHSQFFRMRHCIKTVEDLEKFM